MAVDFHSKNNYITHSGSEKFLAQYRTILQQASKSVEIFLN